MIDAPDPTIVHQVATLTTREREISVLIARGFTMPQIAGKLGRSIYCVRNHVARIHLKLQTVNLAMVAVWATRSGLVDHPEWFDESGTYVGPARREEACPNNPNGS